MIEQPADPTLITIPEWRFQQLSASENVVKRVANLLANFETRQRKNEDATIPLSDVTTFIFLALTNPVFKYEAVFAELEQQRHWQTCTKKICKECGEDD